jgi:hypothetical protein
MIKTFLAPYEVYIWAALAILLLIGGVVVVKHLEDVGVERQQAADAKLAQAQVIHKDEVEKRAQELNSANDSQLHAALVAPAAQPTVAVRMSKCPSTARLVVPANGGTVPGVAGQGGLPAGVGSGGDQTGVAIATSTEELLKRANAKLAYWQTYYAECKAEGACK